MTWGTVFFSADIEIRFQLISKFPLGVIVLTKKPKKFL